MDINPTLRTLTDWAWEEYHRFHEATYEAVDGPRTFVVPDSLPILYFGDLDAYWASGLRVVTAALNPSDEEFPTKRGDPFERFPAMRGVAFCPEETATVQAYIEALGSYFSTNPLTSWFGNAAGDRCGSFEPVLNGLGASYWGERKGMRHTALHTDVISPIATKPTCSGLRQRKMSGCNQTVVAALAERGAPLWRDLMAYLRPDVVLLAVSRADLPAARLPKLDKWREIYTNPDNGHTVRAVQESFAPGSATWVVSATRGNHTPFMNFKRPRRVEIGEIVSGLVHR
ncbi:MAG: hypothetical protein K6T78_15615 [Alicyclobacillus sp.]|nr:hypothetical protein [Alicyclobacillus sp.]